MPSSASGAHHASATSSRRTSRISGCRTPLPSTRSRLSRKNLGPREIAYLHIAEAVAGPALAPTGTVRATPILRRLFGRPVIVNGGYNLDSANAAIASGEADLVAFGVPFLANPDLPERWRRGAPLNVPRFDHFYTGEEKGYIDYPTLEAGHGLKASGATPGLRAGGSDTVLDEQRFVSRLDGNRLVRFDLDRLRRHDFEWPCRFDPEHGGSNDASPE